MSIVAVEAILKFDTLSAANAITKALHPETYGKDIRLLMVREVIQAALAQECLRQAADLGKKTGVTP